MEYKYNGDKGYLKNFSEKGGNFRFAKQLERDGVSKGNGLYHLKLQQNYLKGIGSSRNFAFYRGNPRVKHIDVDISAHLILMELSNVSFI